MLRILLVEDDPDIRFAIADALGDRGDDLMVVEDGDAARAALAGRVFDLVISDVRLPGAIDGMAVLRAARGAHASTEVILMTSFADVRQAVAALSAGARDYLTKPFEMEELLARVRHVRDLRRLEAELAAARERVGRAEGLERTIVGQSAGIVRLRERVATVAASYVPVLVTGESGTGKELVARALHDLGARSSRPFVAVNCAAFPETLLEAELFGHERGAFTGAQKRRAGRFQTASGGTLFLDEIGEMAPPAQAKLLRVLQEGKVTPLGSDTPVPVDVRVVSATNRDLRALVAEKTFREDLFYRLKGVEIHVPPLRDRPGDVPLLVQHFLASRAAETGGPAMSVAAWTALAHYPYPGNVRELQHAIEHALVMARGKNIELEHLPEDISGLGREPAAREIKPLAHALKRFEREYLLAALAAASGKRSKTAELLGISRKNLWEKLKAHGISDSDVDD